MNQHGNTYISAAAGDHFAEEIMSYCPLFLHFGKKKKRFERVALNGTSLCSSFHKYLFCSNMLTANSNIHPLTLTTPYSEDV